MEELEDKDSAVVIGHSFVRRAKIIALRHKKPNLGLNSTDINWIGFVNGKTISSINDVEEWIHTFPGCISETTVLILEIGSNDLQKSYYNNPIGLAEKIYDMAVLARMLGAKRVVINRLLFRSGEAAIARNQQTDMQVERLYVKTHERLFNKCVTATNQKLVDMVKKTGSGLSIEFQEGLLKNWRSKMVDGLHFTDDAYEKYLKNVKSTIIKQTKWAKSCPNPPGLLKL